jgi:hypothetical protein
MFRAYLCNFESRLKFRQWCIHHVIVANIALKEKLTFLKCNDISLPVTVSKRGDLCTKGPYVNILLFLFPLLYNVFLFLTTVSFTVKFSQVLLSLQ